MKSKETNKRRNLKRRRFFFAFVFLLFLFTLLNFNYQSLITTGIKTDNNVNSLFNLTKAEQNKNISINPVYSAMPFGLGAAYQGIKALLSPAGDSMQNIIIQGFNWLLYFVFVVFSWILGVAGLIFDWVVNADNVRNVLARDSIYTVWKIVRDFLNIFFILILLFSAFCTVFQVEKYHLKKVILTIIIMALLVNFSFPISRFIIDASNITMYFFFSSVFPESSGQSASATIVNFSKIADILVPRKETGNPNSGFDSSGPTTQLIMAIIFVFILMITILVIAVMFVIRLVVLAILIIFSPVGFIGILPGKIQGFAGDWWNNLFKYAFFGPIMAFMLVVAYYLMADMAKSNSVFSTMQQTAKNYSNPNASPDVLANMAYFCIPIVILWIGLIVAQKTGIWGANYVTGKAEDFSKWGWRATHVPGTAKKFWGDFGKEGKLFGMKIPLAGSRSREEREQKWAGLITGGRKGYRGAAEANMKKQADEYKKTKSISELKLLAQKGDPAAAYALTETRDIDKAEYEGFMKANKNPVLMKSLDDKVKQNRRDLVAMNRAKDEKEIAKAKDFISKRDNISVDKISEEAAKQHVVNIEMGKLDAEKFANQDWDDVEVTYNNIKDKTEKDRLRNAIVHSFKNLSDEGRAKAREKLSGTNVASLNSITK